MLWIVIAVLALGTIYAITIAPTKQRVMVAVVVIVLTAAGYGAGYAITQPGTDQRTYYPIAAAIAGTMIAFGWISSKRKSWVKNDPKKPR
jgi:hypothetical protein